jgi:hypothetical protein
MESWRPRAPTIDARIPAGCATLALPLLEEAVERIELNDRKAPL